MEFKKINPDLILRIFDRRNLNESDEDIHDKWIEIINDINDGVKSVISKIELHFKNIYNFVRIMIKQGYGEYFDPFSDNLGDYQNEIFYAFYESDTSFIWKIVDRYLSDVTKEGNDYYLDVRDFDDLSGLFNEYRSDISRGTISEILSGEYMMDYWGSVTDDVFRDVYQKLTPEKKERVNNRIREEIEGSVFDVTHRTPSLFDDIAEEQGTEGKINITSDVVTRLLEDEESIEYIMNNELDESKSDLYMIYEGCYRDILVDEWYDDLWGELVGYVVDDKTPKWFTYNKQTWDKEGEPVTKVYEGRRYKVTDCLYETAVDFLTENKNNTYSNNTFEYWGSYLGILGDVKELLRVPRLDDWPDSSKVSKCVNENIGDYF